MSVYVLSNVITENVINPVTAPVWTN